MICFSNRGSVFCGGEKGQMCCEPRRGRRPGSSAWGAAPLRAPPAPGAYPEGPRAAWPPSSPRPSSSEAAGHQAQAPAWPGGRPRRAATAATRPRELLQAAQRPRVGQVLNRDPRSHCRSANLNKKWPGTSAPGHTVAQTGPALLLPEQPRARARLQDRASRHWSREGDLPCPAWTRAAAEARAGVRYPSARLPHEGAQAAPHSHSAQGHRPAGPGLPGHARRTRTVAQS